MGYQDGDGDDKDKKRSKILQYGSILEAYVFNVARKWWEEGAVKEYPS